MKYVVKFDKLLIQDICFVPGRPCGRVHHLACARIVFMDDQYNMQYDCCMATTNLVLRLVLCHKKNTEYMVSQNVIDVNNRRFSLVNISGIATNVVPLHSVYDIMSHELSICFALNSLSRVGLPEKVIYF